VRDVERFIVEIVKELSKRDGVDISVVTDSPKKFVGLCENVIYVESNFRLFWDYVSSLRVVVREKFDIVLYPKNVVPISHLLFLKSKKTIIGTAITAIANNAVTPNT